MRDCSWILRQPDRFKNARPDNFKCCSDRTNDRPNNGYNCIAWAVGKTDNWWWPTDVPGAFWPKGLPKELPDQETLGNFIRAFETEGYSACANSRFENGFEKVGIFVDSRGTPTHAARLLPCGVWTSKMGKYEDIEHRTLQVVECKEYGEAKAFLKRPNPSCQETNQPKRLFTRLRWYLRTLFKKCFPTASNPKKREPKKRH